MAAESANPAPWSAPSASEIADAAGATDLFVFRRITAGRFAHVGGVGRGAGWAGIVEIGEDDEPLVRVTLSSESVVRHAEAEPWHVVGPYYSRAVALVSASPDVIVLFGGDRAITGSDEDLVGLARFASEALVEVAPAKRLADELEALTAVRELLEAPADTFEGALQRLVDQATASLSCEVGLLYVQEKRQLAICDKRPGSRLRKSDAVGVLESIAARGTFPVCIQQAVADVDLPRPLSSANGVLSYYLLEMRRPLPGVLLLLHTTAGAPRGFTLLCQSLGARLVEAAEPLLTAALLRDSLNAELQRATADARRDPLTGLANRLGWSEALAATTVTAQSPASIVQLDCRGLKSINDTYGHSTGDEVLRRIGSCLSAAVRTNDLVARLGGDEFAILLRGADEGLTSTVVERIETALVDCRGADGPQVWVSIGTSTTREGDLDAAHQRADAMMVAAKRAAL